MSNCNYVDETQRYKTFSSTVLAYTLQRTPQTLYYE